MGRTGPPIVDCGFCLLAIMPFGFSSNTETPLPACVIDTNGVCEFGRPADRELEQSLQDASNFAVHTIDRLEWNRRPDPAFRLLRWREDP